MIIVQPSKINIPELLKLANDALLSKEIKVECLSLKYPHFSNYVTPTGFHVEGLYGFRFSNPKIISLHPNDLSLTIARATLSDFVHHCGILAISYISAWRGFEKLWMSVLDDYCQYLGFSALIGGDGESSGNQTRIFIETYGEKWEVKELGKNRRMNRNQSIFWKTLPAKRVLNIDWWKGKNKPDA